MRTRIPRIIAEVNQVMADHANADTKLERAALHLLKHARRMLGQARAKLQEDDVKKAQAKHAGQWR